ncbi:MAG: response regulator [Syntrophobacteraceae bacterium]
METKILVVDDDEGIRDLVAMFLSREGYLFDSAEGLNAARELMGSNNYDIMLIDKNMPGINGNWEGGMDLLKYVRAECLSTEVIMMTGYATIETAIDAMRMGAFDYIQKPFSMADLGQKIKRLCEYRSFIDPDYTIEIYRNIQREVIKLIEKRSGMSDNELDQALLYLNGAIDKLFDTLKESERVLLSQRESLARIASLAEEFHYTPSERGLHVLVEQICQTSHARL